MSEVTTQVHYSPSTTDLIKAVKNNQHNAARKAIRQGANVNVQLPSSNRLLHICLDEQMGAILINHGANVNVVNSLQQTPLHTAMRRDIVPLTQLLINSAANVNAQESTGYTPLHLAEASDVNAALLAKNANPNLQDNYGDTPLHLAIRIKGSPMVTALVDANADKTIKNSAGNDAYGEFNLLVQRREAELEKVRVALYGEPININTAADLSSRLEAVTQQYAATDQVISARAHTPAFNLAQKAMQKLVPTGNMYETTNKEKLRLK